MPTITCAMPEIDVYPRLERLTDDERARYIEFFRGKAGPEFEFRGNPPRFHFYDFGEDNAYHEGAEPQGLVLSRDGDRPGTDHPGDDAAGGLQAEGVGTPSRDAALAEAGASRSLAVGVGPVSRWTHALAKQVTSGRRDPLRLATASPGYPGPRLHCCSFFQIPRAWFATGGERIPRPPAPAEQRSPSG
jgi:hypothetical protein